MSGGGGGGGNAGLFSGGGSNCVYNVTIQGGGAISHVLQPGMQWVPASDGYVPPGAISAGSDKGFPLYVARAFHERDLIPGKLHPRFKVVYISWGGREFSKTHYEVLCGGQAHWVPASKGNLPEGAFEGGYTTSGEKLYIGRVLYNNQDVVGKIHRSHGRCYIPYNGKEHGYESYQALVLS